MFDLSSLSTLITWNNSFEANPQDNDSPKYGDDEIRNLKEAIRERFEKAHTMNTAVGTVGPDGWHKSGSAKLYYQTSEPDTRPDGTTALTADDNGRRWVRSSDKREYVYVHPDWVAVTTLNGANNTFSGNNTFTGTNTFSGSNTFSSSNTFSGSTVFDEVVTFNEHINYEKEELELCLFAHAYGDRSISIGRNSRAQEIDSISIGVSSLADEDDTVAVGPNAHSEGAGTVSIGHDSRTGGVTATDHGHAEIEIATNNVKLTAFYFPDGTTHNDVYDAIRVKVTGNTLHSYGIIGSYNQNYINIMQKDFVSSPKEILFHSQYDNLLTVVNGSGSTLSGDLKFVVLH